MASFCVDGAKEVYGMDATYATMISEKSAPELLRGSERVYYTMFRNKILTRFSAA